MGIGYIIIVDEKKKKKAIEVLRKKGFSSHLIGTIERGVEGVSYAKD